MDCFLFGGMAFDNNDLILWYVEKLAEEGNNFFVGLVIFCGAGYMDVDGMSPGMVFSWEKGFVAVSGDLEMDEAAFGGWC
jgi:hypothetical protein